MNEPKTMTIQDCKLTLDEVRMIIEGHKENRSTPSEAMQFDYVLSLLARVEQPSEEDRAVLWLLRWKGWKFLYDQIHLCWMRETMRNQWEACTPIEEAKKLGWGGRE